MAASSSTAAASSSTAAHSNNTYCHEVFINHRGPDVKETFARDLYTCLHFSHGLRVFLDQPELQAGEKITSQIEDAIRTASVHVAIFSPGYADSNWCLDELVLMLKSGATIIPVFYNVKPSVLRWTGGLYAKSLHNLATKKTQDGKLRYDPPIIEKWRDALSRVADISGFELQESNGGPEELLDKVVKAVLKRVPKNRFNVAKYPTGVDEKLKEFENTVLLQLQHSGKPKVIGIFGLGGVGKTTLANALFNQKSSDYSRSCLLSDVREVGKGPLISLQRNLIESLGGRNVQKIQNIDEGIEMLKELLKSSQILLVLDDVDRVDQVDALLPVLNVNSLVLITSRNKDVLTSSGVEESAIYKLTGLNAQHSRELFCCHAFSQPHPRPGFESLVDKFLQACDGLPLSLKVFGALLCGKDDTSYWEDQLLKLQRWLPNEIKERLKVSFEALDMEEQQIFLDIACFFIGRNRDTAIKIWEASGWTGRLGFRNLQSRCLVEVENGNEIHMHDHLRDLGREIAETSSPHRLWGPRENIDEQSSVITVRGIRIVRSSYPRRFCHQGIRIQAVGGEAHNDNNDAYGGIIARRLQLFDIEDGYLAESILKRAQSPNLIWLHWKDYPGRSLPSWIPMKNLRVLQVSSDVLEILWESKSQAPLLLRELEICAPLFNIPNSIGQLKHLERVIVDSPDQFVNLRELPEEFCNLLSLKTLVLRYCQLMSSLPDSFGNLTKLEHLDLSNCRGLRRLPISFGNLISLKYLKLTDCWNLAISSETLGNISTLEYINFFKCHEIDVLPQLAHQRSLVNLDFSYTNLKGLPSEIGELTNLEVLRIGTFAESAGCPLLETLPPSMVGDFRNFTELMFDISQQLKCAVTFTRQSTQLTELGVFAESAGCPLLKTLPRSMGDLRNLKELTLNNCKQLKCSLTFVGQLTQLTKLRVIQCPLIRKLSLPPTVELLNLHGSKNLRKIEGLCDLAKLRSLCIPCNELEVEELCIERLVSLEALDISGWVKQKSTRGLDPLIAVGLLTQLTELGFSDCSLIRELSLPHTLIRLNLMRCHNLKRIEGLCGLAKLEQLNITDCSKLEVEDLCIETLVSLKVLEIRGCVNLKRIRGFEPLTNLYRIEIKGCRSLEKLDGIEHLKGMDKISTREDCPRLQWDKGVVEQLRQETFRLEI